MMEQESETKPAYDPPAAKKTRGKRAVTRAKKKPTSGRKTLIAAVAACIVAATDLFMTLRYGLKLF